VGETGWKKENLTAARRGSALSPGNLSGVEKRRHKGVIKGNEREVRLERKGDKKKNKDGEQCSVNFVPLKRQNQTSAERTAIIDPGAFLKRDSTAEKGEGDGNRLSRKLKVREREEKESILNLIIWGTKTIS